MNQRNLRVRQLKLESVSRDLLKKSILFPKRSLTKVLNISNKCHPCKESNKLQIMLPYLSRNLSSSPKLLGIS